VKKKLYVKTGWYKEKENNHVQGDEEEAVYFEWGVGRDPGGTEKETNKPEHVTQSLMEEEDDVDGD